MRVRTVTTKKFMFALEGQEANSLTQILEHFIGSLGQPGVLPGDLEVAKELHRAIGEAKEGYLDVQSGA